MVCIFFLHTMGHLYFILFFNYYFLIFFFTYSLHIPLTAHLLVTLCYGGKSKGTSRKTLEPGGHVLLGGGGGLLGGMDSIEKLQTEPSVPSTHTHTHAALRCRS